MAAEQIAAQLMDSQFAGGEFHRSVDVVGDDGAEFEARGGEMAAGAQLHERVLIALADGQQVIPGLMQAGIQELVEPGEGSVVGANVEVHDAAFRPGAVYGKAG